MIDTSVCMWQFFAFKAEMHVIENEKGQKQLIAFMAKELYI